MFKFVHVNYSIFILLLRNPWFKTASWFFAQLGITFDLSLRMNQRAMPTASCLIFLKIHLALIASVVPLGVLHPKVPAHPQCQFCKQRCGGPRNHLGGKMEGNLKIRYPQIASNATVLSCFIVSVNRKRSLMKFFEAKKKKLRFFNEESLLAHMYRRPDFSRCCFW